MTLSAFQLTPQVMKIWIPLMGKHRASCGTNKACWRFSAARYDHIGTISHSDHCYPSITLPGQTHSTLIFFQPGCSANDQHSGLSQLVCLGSQLVCLGRFVEQLRNFWLESVPVNNPNERREHRLRGGRADSEGKERTALNTRETHGVLSPEHPDLSTFPSLQPWMLRK